MRARTSLLLVMLAAVVLGGGWFFGLGPDRPAASSVAPGSLAFPGLAGALRRAATVEIAHQKTTLTLAKHGEVWGLPDRGFYPVQDSKLHAMLTALTELRLTEARTSDPAEYGRLGVEDPRDAAATSELLRVLDADGKPLAELIVGHRRIRTGGQVPESVYVRRVGDAQAWLAEGSLSVDADPQLWIVRDVMDIPHDRVASVAVMRGEQSLAFARVDGKPALTAPADHPKLDDYKVEDVFRGLEQLTLTDVKPAGQAPGTPVGKSTVTTTDGMTVEVSVAKAGAGDKGELWARFEVTGGGPAGDALRKRVGGWAYQLGAWKESSLVPTIDMLKAAEPSPAAAPPTAPQ